MQPLNTGNSLATNFNQVNSLMRAFQNRQQVEIFKDSTGTPVVILDSNGLRTTKPGSGVDVTSANSNQYTFNSAQDVFKIASSGNTTIPGLTISTPGAAYTSNNSTIVIPHGQTTTPAVIAFLSISGSYYALPYNSPSGFGSSAVWFSASFFIDNTNITFTQGALVFGTGITIAAAPVRYYILVETAT